MIKENDRLTEKVIRCCYNVHSGLGPGYNEKVYMKALKSEFESNEIKYEMEKKYDVCYKQKMLEN